MNNNEVTITVTEEQARSIISALERDDEKNLAGQVEAELNQQLYGNDDDGENDPFHGRDGDADADALSSAGMGTDEDYGDFGQNEEHFSDDE
jgi:hypothetical protein